MPSENPGSAAGDGKGTPYHCNYCNKAIIGRTRMTCAVCDDFDLCVECVLVGAALTPHKSGHSFKVMDNLSFSGWNADEELLLLEGVKMFGLDNWGEVAGHVGTKTKAMCMEHYRDAHINSVPDSTQVVGKDKNEVGAMGKDDVEDGIGDLEDKTDTLSKSILGDEDDIWTRAYVDSPKREELVVDMGLKEADPDFVHQLKCRVVKAYKRRAEDRSRYAGLGDEERELCQKYDSCLRFDSDEEHKQVIDSLLALHRFQKRKAAIKEARDAGCRTIAEFNEYHELIKEREAEEWKENSEEEDATASKASSAASNSKPRSLTTDELSMYLDREFKQKQKQAAVRKENSRMQQHLESKRKEEEGARGREISVDPARNRSSWISPSAVSPGGMTVAEIDMDIQRLRKEDEERDPYWSNITSCSTMSFLSASETPLCQSLRMAPRRYLKIKEDMTKLIINGRITKKSDSYRFFDQIVPYKIDKIYDLLTNKGIAPP